MLLLVDRALQLNDLCKDRKLRLETVDFVKGRLLVEFCKNMYEMLFCSTYKGLGRQKKDAWPVRLIADNTRAR